VVSGQWSVVSGQLHERKLLTTDYWLRTTDYGPLTTWLVLTPIGVRIQITPSLWRKITSAPLI